MQRLPSCSSRLHAERSARPGAYLNNELVRQSPSRCQEVGIDTSLGNTSINGGCFDIFGRLGGPNYSWISSTLPFFGLVELHDQIDFSLTAQAHFSSNLPDASNTLPARVQSVFAEELKQLICPADGGPKAHYAGGFAPGFAAHGIRDNGGFAKTNYVGFTSTVHLDHFKNRQGALGGFDLGSATGLRLSQIRDGANHTLLLTEVRTLDQDWDSRGAWALPFPGAALVSLDWHAIEPGSPDYMPHPNFNPDHLALPNSQTYRDVIVGVQAQHAPVTVAAQMPAIGFATSGGFLGAAPRSQHSGGVYTGMVNGEVRFLSDEVNPIVVARLVYTKDGRLERQAIYK